MGSGGGVGGRGRGGGGAGASLCAASIYGQEEEIFTVLVLGLFGNWGFSEYTPTPH